MPTHPWIATLQDVEIYSRKLQISMKLSVLKIRTCSMYLQHCILELLYPTLILLRCRSGIGCACRLIHRRPLLAFAKLPSAAEAAR